MFTTQLRENQLLTDEQKEALLELSKLMPEDVLNGLTEDLSLQNQAYTQIIENLKQKFKQNFAFYKGMVMGDSNLSEEDKTRLTTTADSELSEILKILE
ncbi:hypothetical protein JW962_02675 [Candidatus Dojkabacteria bacterium]|nr:hypothetical protein [Candidatus Dojkabacteria bacterium]